MSKRNKILIGVGLTLVLTVVIVLNIRGKKEDAVEVQTEKVKRGDVIKTVSASGKIQPVTDIKISSNVSAKILQLTVKEGDKVKRGQVLVSLDRTFYDAQLDQAKAEHLRAKSQVATAQANYEKAQQDFARVKDLTAKQLASASELEVAQTTLSTTRASVESAESQVQAAEASAQQAADNLSKTTIYAPIDGTISKLNKKVGEIALGSQFSQDVIMIVANLNEMEARVNVDENDVVAVEIGDTAVIEVDALTEQKLRGRVTEIANSATVKATGTSEEKTEFEVKIALDDTPLMLRPGMSTTSDITTDVRGNTLKVPIQCVTVREPERLKRKEGVEKEGAAMASDTNTQFVPNKDGVVEIVFVIENGMAVARPVKTGIQSESHIEILDGIKENDEVVVGNFRAISKILENGSKVKVDNEKKPNKDDNKEARDN